VDEQKTTVPNRVIELHDTCVEGIEQVHGRIVLRLSAYLHESEGRPGIDRGTGWTLPARLVIENGRYDRPFVSHSLWVIDGHISIDDSLLDNCIPLPFDKRGRIRLFLAGAEGELAISGDRVYVEPMGPAVYVEEFPGTDPT
jgi:hypothetical protein